MLAGARTVVAVPKEGELIGAIARSVQARSTSTQSSLSKPFKRTARPSSPIGLPGISPAVRLILSSSSGWKAARLPRWRSIHERCSRTCWPPPAHHSRRQAIGEGVYLVWHPRAIAPTRYGVRRAAMKPARPASIASVFRPGPVDRRSRTIAACRRGRSRSRRISDNRHRSRRG
jgi:hypothetical protein